MFDGVLGAALMAIADVAKLDLERVLRQRDARGAVSYTHLDVYKRQIRW